MTNTSRIIANNCSTLALGNPWISGCYVNSPADFAIAPRHIVHVNPSALHDYSSKKRVAVVVVGVATNRDCDLLVELPAPVTYYRMVNVTHMSIRANETQEGVRFVRNVIRFVKMLAMLGREMGKQIARDQRAAATKRANAGKVGTCQICANEHKLGTGAHTGMIVLHGYTRPGYGYTIGSCFGVAELPFERSRDALGRWIVELHRIKADRVQTLAELPKRRSFTVERSTGYGHNKTVTMHEITKAADPIGWKTELAARVYLVESEIRHVTRDIEMQQARFDSWKPAA